MQRPRVWILRIFASAAIVTAGDTAAIPSPIDAARMLEHVGARAASLFGIDTQAEARPAEVEARPAPRKPEKRSFWKRLKRFIEDWLTPILLVAPSILVIAVYMFIRYRPRWCWRCLRTMVRLGEGADDVYLSPGQKAEEHAGSVEYDVWLCRGCGAVAKWQYANLPSTIFADCPQCKYRTAEKTTRTLKAATPEAEGQEEITERCRHCSFESIAVEAISWVNPEDSDSGSSWVGESDSLGGGSDSSGGGSDSLGGGSDSSSGGGSSSGEGASGRW